MRLVRDGDEGQKESADRHPSSQHPEPFDPWNTEGNEGYSVDRFYTKSTDGRGNSETKYVKVPPSVIGSIGNLIAMRHVQAYRSDGDFIRDAIIHRLKQIAEMLKDGKLDSDVNRWVMLDRVAQRQLELAELGSLIKHHEEAMQQCVSEGDTLLLDVLLSDAEGDLQQLRPAYKARLSKIIDKFRRELAGMVKPGEHEL